MLSEFDCQVDIAGDGHEAIKLWKQNQYDLIFMDIGLPDMEGYEVTHQIRVQELAKKSHIPIIALTAHAGEENKQRCIEAGMNAVLTKPLTAKSCADIVDAFIPGRQLSDAALYRSPLGVDLPEREEDLFNLSPYPTLDIEAGINTTGDEVMLAEMLRILVEVELPSDLEKMKTAFTEKNWDKTQDLAHKIKGGAVYVGTIKMKMACQHLERYWKAGHRDLFEKLYEQTVVVIEETMQKVDGWLNKKQ